MDSLQPSVVLGIGRGYERLDEPGRVEWRLARISDGLRPRPASRRARSSVATSACRAFAAAAYAASYIVRRWASARAAESDSSVEVRVRRGQMTSSASRTAATCALQRQHPAAVRCLTHTLSGRAQTGPADVDVGLAEDSPRSKPSSGSCARASRAVISFARWRSRSSQTAGSSRWQMAFRRRCTSASVHSGYRERTTSSTRARGSTRPDRSTRAHDRAIAISCAFQNSANRSGGDMLARAASTSA